MKPAAFEHAAPAEAREAFALLSRDGVKPLSGGQSLAPTMNLRMVRPALLVDVKRLPGQRGFSETADHLRLGAATTHAEIEDGLVPDVTNGLMRHVAHGIAYRAVRNRGTIGGSLAQPEFSGQLQAARLRLGPWLDAKDLALDAQLAAGAQGVLAGRLRCAACRKPA